MADGTIKIDIDIPTDKVKSDKEQVDRILNSIGKGAGKDLDSNFKKQTSKLTNTASEAHSKVNRELGKPVKTKLEANDTNLKEKTKSAQRDVDKIPKSKETKLEAKDNGFKEKTSNAANNVKKIPKSKKTELQAKDEASPTLKKVDNQTEQTGHKFHKLRDIVKGTFIGSSLANGLSNALSAVGSHVMGVVHEGMQLNTVTAGIQRRFNNLMPKSAANAYMKQIAYLKTRISATGEDIANLQVNTTNWSKIGRKGAMEMVTAMAAMGDRTGMTSDGYKRLAMMVQRVGSSGKVTIGTLSRMARVAPGLYKQLAKGAGMSVTHLKALLATGKVTTTQFQKWLANSAKGSNKAFKAYEHTQAGAANRMQKTWQTLEQSMTKPLFNMKTSGLNKMADLMSSPAVKSGAKLIGNAVQRIARFGLQILAAISRHKADLSATMSDVVKIGGTLAKDMWKDFAAILGDIGKSLGLTNSNAKKSGSSLHTVREVMDGLAKNKTAMQIIARTIELMAAVKLATTVNSLLKISTFAKGGLGAIIGLAKGFHGIEDVSKLHGAQKYFYNLANAIRHPKGALSDLATSFKNNHKIIAGALSKMGKTAKSAFSKIANSASSVGKKMAAKLEQGKSAIAKAGSKLGQAFKKAWQKTATMSLGKRAGVGALAGAAVAAPEAINAVRDRHSASARSKDIGGGIGAIAGGTLTSMIPVVGPWLAPIGAEIGKYAGRFGGEFVDKFTKGWQKKKPPKNKWSIENLGWSTKNAMKQAGHWGAGVIRSMAKGINKGQNNLKKAFAKSSRNMHSAAKGLGRWGNQVRKNTQSAFSKAGSAAKKGWNFIVKHTSVGTRHILKSVGDFGKRYIKSHQRYTKATLKNFGSFGKRFRKNHYQLFKTIGQTAKAQLKIEQRRWHDNWSNIRKTSKGIWHGIQENSRNFYNNLNHLSGGGLGKVLSAFHSFGGKLKGFWSNLLGGIKSFFDKVFSGIADTIGKISNGIDKLKHGKVRVGSLHLANGTDWRATWGIPAILNDGSDSPETHNRESIIHPNGLWELLPDVPFLKRWLLPTDEVVNARDTARYFGTGVQHFARGTTRLARIPTRRANISAIVRGIAEIRQLIKAISHLKSKTVKVTARVKGTREMAKLAKSFKKVRNVKRRITVKVAGESKVRSLSRSTAKAARGLKSIRSAASRATRPLRTLSRQARSTGSRLNRLYKDARRDKFGSAIAKQAEKAVNSLKGKGNFAKTFSRLTKSTEKSLKTMHKVGTKEFKELWSNLGKSAKSGESRINKSVSSFGGRFKRQFKSIQNGVHSSFGHFWSSMAGTAKRGLNKTIGILNSAIGKIDSVVHEFGGSTHAVHKVSRLATGTGYFAGRRRPITKPTLAIVNDGNDSPETGNREAKWNPRTGEIGVFEGRNVPTILQPGEEILNATEAREFGITSPKHFASGTGALAHLYHIAKHNWEQPVKTAREMFSSIHGLSGAIKQLANGQKNTGESDITAWWSQLWKMVEDRVNSGGDVSGFLKEAIKVSKGHRYVWGAHGPTTFDCSGLVQYVAEKLGIPGLHQPSSAEYAAVEHIPRSQIRMNDLVFYGPHGNEHVGIVRDKNTYWSAHSPSSHPNIGYDSIDDAPSHPILFGRIRGYHDKDKGKGIKANGKLQKLIKQEVWDKGFTRTIDKIRDKYGDNGMAGAFRLGGSIGARARAIARAIKQAIPGATRNGLAAIIGNWAFESTLNPGAINPGGGATGFGQWTSSGNRKERLFAYARRHHTSWRNPATQINFAVHGDTGNTGIFHRIATSHGSVAALANEFSRLWERGGYDSNHVAAARQIYGTLHGFASGGIVSSPQVAKVAEGGYNESIVPWDPAQRQRAYQIMQATLDNFKRQDGQAQQYQKQAQQAVDLTKTNSEIESLNAKFDDALAALGLLTSKDQVINVQNTLNGRVIGNSVYEVIKHNLANEARNEVNRISGH